MMDGEEVEEEEEEVSSDSKKKTAAKDHCIHTYLKDSQPCNIGYRYKGRTKGGGRSEHWL